MSARVRVRHHRGHLAAVKVGLDPTRDVELVREAAMLTVARHPGVVGLLALTKGPDGLELITAWVGTRSLADTRLLAPTEGAGVVGALAATVADLHRHGIVHGSIEPSHVLLDDRGRPVLCSFSHAALVTRQPSDAPRPSDDVGALGELLVTVLGSPDDPELVPTRRFARRHEHHLHRDILTIADHARAHDRASRPSAASLAAALADLAPATSLPPDVAGASPTALSPTGPSAGSAPVEPNLDAELDRLRATAATVRARRRRWPFVAGAVVGLLSIGAVGAVSAGAPSRSATGEVPLTPRAIPAAPPARPASTTTVAPAPVVEIDHQQFEVGAPGDLASAAPWRCDGRTRVVLLRPSTGELFLFDNAPEPGGDSVANPFHSVAHATGLARVDPDDACPALVVVRADGTATTVDLPAPP